jgi:hypothetical protein
MLKAAHFRSTKRVSRNREGVGIVLVVDGDFPAGDLDGEGVEITSFVTLAGNCRSKLSANEGVAHPKVAFLSLLEPGEAALGGPWEALPLF